MTQEIFLANFANLQFMNDTIDQEPISPSPPHPLNSFFFPNSVHKMENIFLIFELLKSQKKLVKEVR